jgi:fumarate reductase subunit D
MSQETQTASPDRAETIDFSWRGLYTIGGAAALICALMYLITLGVYVPANLASPPPETVLEWFTVFEDSPITGLFFLGLGDIVIMILWGPMALALDAALKRSNRTWSMIATSFVFVGMAVFLATNTAFSMLSLSQEYALAATEAEKSILLAAGQAMLTVSRGTGALYTGMPLVWLAGVIISVVMLRSEAFSRATAWVGILGLGLLVVGILGGGHYTSTGESTAVQSAIVAVQYIGGGLLSLAWYILVGLRLLKIGRTEGRSGTGQ